VRVVVVLGGGGAKTLAHAGAWQALEEAGGRVTHVIATSMGAVIGAALAAGKTPAQVLQAAQAISTKDAAALDPLSLLKGVFASSLFKRAALKRTIAHLVATERFADLDLPLTVTATDVDSGDLVLFGAPVPGVGSARYLGADAPLLDVLYASCALPLYFAPETITGRRLADGGLRAVLPLKVAAQIPADLVLAVSVGSGFDEPVPPASHGLFPPALVRAHDDALRIMMAAQTETAIAEWPPTAPRLVVVRAVAERNATFAVGQAERYYKAGYEQTKREMQKRA
jgi:NTE family protein